MTLDARPHSSRSMALLWLALGFVAALAAVLGFARPARADDPMPAQFYDLSFGYSEGAASSVVTNDTASGVITIDAPAGTVTISDVTRADYRHEGLNQIVVAKTNRATIHLGAVTVNRLNDPGSRHFFIFNGDTTLDVTGENAIYANNTFSAIWSPAKLTIVSSTDDGSLDLYEEDAGTKNAAISVIAKDLLIDDANVSIDGLLLGGTLRGTTTVLDGTLTINGGTITARNPANYQHAISAGTLTINGGEVTAEMTGLRSDALSATTLAINGGTVSATASGASGYAVNAGTLTMANETGTGAGGPTLTASRGENGENAISGSAILKASTKGEDDFYPWFATGGASENGATVQSFAGAPNSATAATSGIPLSNPWVRIQPAELTKLGFKPVSNQSGVLTEGVKAGDTVTLELDYAFNGVTPNFGSVPLPTFFPIKDDVIVPSGNATTSYSGGEAGTITFGAAPKGRTTSIRPAWDPALWSALTAVYGSAGPGAATTGSALTFPMRYPVTFELGGGNWSWPSANPVLTGSDGKLQGVPFADPTLTDATKGFAYWKVTAGESVGSALTTSQLASTVFNEATTLEAVWVTKSHTVTFDPNGGSWLVVSGSIEQNVESNGRAVPPAEAPVNGDKVFLGWYAGSGNSWTRADFDEAITGDTTFKAQWGTLGLSLAPEAASARTGEAVPFTVTATVTSEANGVPLPKTIDFSDLAIATSPLCQTSAPTIDGLVASFSLTAPANPGDITVTVSMLGQSDESTVTVFGGDQITVTFDGNEGTWDEGKVPFKILALDEGSQRLSASQREQLNGITNGSHQLLAWYQWIEEDAHASGDGSITYGHWHSVDLETFDFTESMTLTAMWADPAKASLVLWPLTAEAYPGQRATFTAALLPQPLDNGVLPPYNFVPSSQMAASSLEVRLASGAQTGAVIGPVRQGSATNTLDFDVTAPPSPTPTDPAMPGSGGVIIDASYPKESTEGQLTASAVLTVVPRPAPGSFLVTFDANGGSWDAEGGQTATTVRVRPGRTIPAPVDPQREGHVFAGWGTEAEGFEPVDLSTYVPKGAMTLYAHWIPEAPSGEGTAVYRLYSHSEKTHLYTTDVREVAFLTKGGWTPEGDDGIYWYAPAEPVEGTSVILRFYNPSSHDHYYCPESDTVQVERLKSDGWLQDSAASNILSAPASGGIPVFTLFNPNATVDTHLYTPLTNEFDVLRGLGWQPNTTIIWALQA